MHVHTTFLHQTPIPIELVVGTCSAAQGKDYPLHSHDVWELCYIRTGHIAGQQGENLYPLYPGMAILHPPHVFHADFARTAYTTYFIMFEAPPDQPWSRLYYDDEDLNLDRICRAIVREWREQQADRDDMLALLNKELLLLLGRGPHDSAKSLRERSVIAAEQIMEASYGKRIEVAELAERVGISVSSLHAHFVRLRGKTPMEYLQGVRLRHALGLLHHSTLTLETIADLCGYHSPSHLSRHVKAATGASPGRLRLTVGPL